MVGDSHPAYIIAEIGINHNGDLGIAKQMIDAAIHAGVDAVKFQKRTPDIATPPEQQNQMRETPWGYISYLDYRYRVEFNEEQYREIDRHCREKGIAWLVSVWDQQSVDFMEQFDTRLCSGQARAIEPAPCCGRSICSRKRSRGRQDHFVYHRNRSPHLGS